MTDINWDIRRTGRAWCAEEVWQRYELAPEKIELIEGKLFWTEEDRLRMPGLLLEQVGIDKAIRLGDPEIWRAACMVRIATQTATGS